MPPEIKNPNTEGAEVVKDIPILESPENYHQNQNMFEHQIKDLTISVHKEMSQEPMLSKKVSDQDQIRGSSNSLFQSIRLREAQKKENDKNDNLKKSTLKDVSGKNLVEFNTDFVDESENELNAPGPSLRASKFYIEV